MDPLEELQRLQHRFNVQDKHNHLQREASTTQIAHLRAELNEIQAGRSGLIIFEQACAASSGMIAC